MTLDIPEGALAQSVDVTIEKVDVPPEGAIGPVYSFEPDGLTFEKPVLIRLAWAGDWTDGQSFEESAIAVYEDERWKPLPVGAGAEDDADDKILIGATDHFSYYGPLNISPDQEPDWDGETDYVRPQCASDEGCGSCTWDCWTKHTPGNLPPDCPIASVISTPFQCTSRTYYTPLEGDHFLKRCMEAKFDCFDRCVQEEVEECCGDGVCSKLETPEARCPADCSCGNGLVDNGEECDGDAFDGRNDCADLEMAGGALRCTSDCEVDSSSCHVCGDGFCHDDETPQGCSIDCGAGQFAGTYRLQMPHLYCDTAHDGWDPAATGTIVIDEWGCVTVSVFGNGLEVPVLDFCGSDEHVFIKVDGSLSIGHFVGVCQIPGSDGQSGTSTGFEMTVTIDSDQQLEGNWHCSDICGGEIRIAN